MGITFQTQDINGVEIFNEGKHGTDYYSRADLLEMIDAHGRLGFLPIVKADDGEMRRVFGAPALGYVKRIYVRGIKLLADLVNVPKRFAEIIQQRRFSRLGCEVYFQYKDELTGRTYPRVLKAINFIGTNVALDSLAAIESLFDQRSTVANRYDGQNEFRTNILEDIMNNETWKRYEYERRKTVYEHSLTARSTEFAQAAYEYALQHDCDFPTAVRELMRIAREYSADTPK